MRIECPENLKVPPESSSTDGEDQAEKRSRWIFQIQENLFRSHVKAEKKKGQIKSQSPTATYETSFPN